MSRRPAAAPQQRRDTSPDVVDHAPLGSPVPGREQPESYIAVVEHESREIDR